MPSPAIPGGILTRMRAGHQAVRWKTTLGLIVQFRAFCCDINSDGIMGVSKEPVPVLDLNADVLCLGDTLTWDLRDSYAPGSTIDAYAIDMDDGTQYFIDHGTHVYGAVGTYTIEGTVHEGTCRQQTVEAQVEVIDCDDAVFMSFTYASQYGGGVWYRDWSVGTWVARNTGLIGDALNVNSIALRPGARRLPDTVHELWAATDDGVFRTFNGGRSWGKIGSIEADIEVAGSPLSVAGQPRPTDPSSVTFHKIIFDPIDPNIVYVVGTGLADDEGGCAYFY